MMSLLTLTGFAFGGFGSADSDDADDLRDDEFLYEHEGWAQHGVGSNLMDPSSGYDADFGAANSEAETIDMARGDAISAFNPKSDTLELEYTAALGSPEVSITDFADGTGASVALNGVVVADVTGAQGLDPSVISLIAV